MVSLTTGELMDKQQQIQNSDLTSLSTLVSSEGETTIELVDTLESHDRSADPEHQAGWDEANQKFRRASERVREPRVADPLATEEPDPRSPVDRRSSLPRSRLAARLAPPQ